MTDLLILDSLLTGVPSIDKEHQELFARLDSVLNDPNARIGSSVFSEYLSQLGQQLAIHFTNEERFLVTAGMPADMISSHIKTHDEIIQQYVHLNLDLLDGKRPDRTDALVLIKDWIVTHVIRYDLEIRKYLPSQALDPREDTVSAQQ